MKFFLVYLSAIILLFFASCSKTGPEGPPGTNGVANITSFDVTVTTWSYDNTYGFYYSTGTIADITQAVVDNGTVQAFSSSSDFSSFSALPNTQGLLWIGYDYFLNSIEFDWGLTNGAQPGYPNTQYFKVVVIPPAQRLANPDVNYKDYNDIAKHFKIQEIPLSLSASSAGM